MRKLCLYSLLMFSPVILQAEDINKTTVRPRLVATGEYSGEVLDEGGEAIKVGVQIAARGNGKYDAIGYIGGLPGSGEELGEPVISSGEWKNRQIHFPGDMADVIFEDGVIRVIENGGKFEIGVLPRTDRVSPTLAAKAPENAILLFTGPEQNLFKAAQLKEQYLLPQGKLQQELGHGKFHLEFFISAAPQPRTTEESCQLLFQHLPALNLTNSFCNPVGKQSCGNLEGKQPPSVNGCFPPGVWQTLDIDFLPDHCTIRLNGIVIHEQVQYQSNPEATPLEFNDKGLPIQFRNIWFVEK